MSNNNDILLLIFWLCLCFGLTLSPALISIGFAAIACLGLLKFKNIQLSKSEKIVSVFFLLFFLSGLFSIIYSTDIQEASRKLILKLPILLAPCLILSFKNLSEKTIQFLIGILIYAAYLPSVVSVYNYFKNKALFDQLILESKPLPIEFGYGIYHIQFSIFLASSIIISLFYVIQMIKSKSINIYFYFVVTTGILNLIFLHILSTRTGLLSLYIGLAMTLFLSIGKMNRKSITIAITAVILLPIIMVLSSQSLQNRINNSITDFKVVWNNENPNEYSFAMRVHAWKNALDLLKSNWVIGVGIGDAENELKNNFEKFNPKIDVKNRKNPHFQAIESTVQSGVLALISYFAIFISIFIFYRKKQALAVVISSMFLLASCFESLLERQASVVCFAALIPLSMALFLNQNKKAI